MKKKYIYILLVSNEKMELCLYIHAVKKISLHTRIKRMKNRQKDQTVICFFPVPSNANILEN